MSICSFLSPSPYFKPYTSLYSSMSFPLPLPASLGPSIVHAFISSILSIPLSFPYPSVPPFLSLCLCLSVSASLCLCLSVSASLCLSLSLRLSVSVSVSLTGLTLFCVRCVALFVFLRLFFVSLASPEQRGWSLNSRRCHGDEEVSLEDNPYHRNRRSAPI